MHKNKKECSSGSESENNTWGKAPRGNAEVTKVARYLDNECVFDKEWAFNRMCTLQSLLSARVLQCSSSRNFVSRRRIRQSRQLRKKPLELICLMIKTLKESSGHMQTELTTRLKIAWWTTGWKAREFEKHNKIGTPREIPKKRIVCLQVHNRNMTTHSFRELEVIKLSKNNAVAGRCVARQRRKQRRWKRTATDAKRKVWEKELIKSKIKTWDHLPSRRNGTGRDEQTRQNRAQRNFVVPDLGSDCFVPFDRMLWTTT